MASGISWLIRPATKEDVPSIAWISQVKSGLMLYAAAPKLYCDVRAVRFYILRRVDKLDVDAFSLHMLWCCVFLVD